MLLIEGNGLPHCSLEEDRPLERMHNRGTAGTHILIGLRKRPRVKKTKAISSKFSSYYGRSCRGSSVVPYTLSKCKGLDSSLSTKRIRAPFKYQAGQEQVIYKQRK